MSRTVRRAVMTTLAVAAAVAVSPRLRAGPPGEDGPPRGLLAVPYVPGKPLVDDAPRVFVALPSAAPAVLEAIRARGVPGRVTGVAGGPDAVRLGICPGPDDAGCRELVLGPPADACAGPAVGPWCIAGASDGDLAAFPGLRDALAAVPRDRAWTTARAGGSPGRETTASRPGRGIPGPGSWLARGHAPPAPWRIVGPTADGGDRSGDLPLRAGAGGDAPGFAVGWAEGSGACLLRTRSFCLYEPDAPAGPLPVTTADLDALGAWLESLDRPCAMPPFHAVGAMRALLVAAALALLAGLVLVAVRGLRAGRRGRAVGAHLAALSATAAALRGFVSPWAFVQEYLHAADHLAALQCGPPLPYGEAGPALAGLVHALTGAGAGAIFGTHWVLASLTPAAVAWLGRELAGRWAVGLAAGWLVCLLPQHLRFSASEALFVPALFFMATGLAAVARHLRTGAWGVLALGALALFLATQTRPEALLALALVPLLAPRGPGARAGWRALGAWAAVFAVAAAWLGIRRLLPAAAHVEVGAILLPWQRYLRWVWFETAVTPPALWVPWIVGIVVGLRRRRAATAWALAGGAAFALATLHFFDNDVYRQRSQLLAVPFLAIPAGLGLAWAADTLRAIRVPRVVASLLLLAALAFPAHARRAFVTRVTPEMVEWVFLDRTIPLLPAGPGVRLHAATRGSGAFPTERLWLAGSRVDVRDPASLGPSSRAGDDRPTEVLYYQGLGCHLGDPSAAPGGAAMRPACDDLRRRWRLEPLHVLEIRAEGDPDVGFLPGPSGPFTVGFFRVGGVRAGDPAGPP